MPPTVHMTGVIANVALKSSSPPTFFDKIGTRQRQDGRTILIDETTVGGLIPHSHFYGKSVRSETDCCSLTVVFQQKYLLMHQIDEKNEREGSERETVTKPCLLSATIFNLSFLTFKLTLLKSTP
jgi:hypothetical protein